jgi:hypothetical protein
MKLDELRMRLRELPLSEPKPNEPGTCPDCLRSTMSARGECFSCGYKSVLVRGADRLVERVASVEDYLLEELGKGAPLDAAHVALETLFRRGVRGLSLGSREAAAVSPLTACLQCGVTSLHLALCSKCISKLVAAVKSVPDTPTRAASPSVMPASFKCVCAACGVEFVFCKPRAAPIQIACPGCDVEQTV